MMIWVGLVSWKALIIVYLVSFLGMRLLIDKIVEKVILIPFVSIIYNMASKNKKWEHQ